MNGCGALSQVESGLSQKAPLELTGSASPHVRIGKRSAGHGNPALRLWAGTFGGLDRGPQGGYGALPLRTGTARLVAYQVSPMACSFATERLAASRQES